MQVVQPKNKLPKHFTAPEVSILIIHQAFIEAQCVTRLMQLFPPRRFYQQVSPLGDFSNLDSYFSSSDKQTTELPMLHHGHDFTQIVWLWKHKIGGF